MLLLLLFVIETDSDSHDESGAEGSEQARPACGGRHCSEATGAGDSAESPGSRRLDRHPGRSRSFLRSLNWFSVVILHDFVVIFLRFCCVFCDGMIVIVGLVLLLWGWNYNRCWSL